MWTTRSQDESGVALVTALLASVILGGVAIVITSVAVTNLRVTGETRDRDATIHVAEAGAELVVARMNDEPEWTSPQVLAAPPADPRTWAVQAAYDARDSGATGPNISRTPTQFSFGLRPIVAGEASDVIYGVGILEGRTEHVRVVTYQVADDPFRPDHAILSNGDLRIGNNSSVTGTGGSVHTNGNLIGGVSVEGSATASGGSCSFAGGNCTADSPPVSVPSIYAAQLYEYHEGHEDVWFDLCPDGQMYRPSPDGPCATSAIRVENQQEWAFDPKTQIWTRHTSEPIDGIFYAHNASIELHGHQVLRGTVLASAPAGSPDNGRWGNVRIRAQVSVQPMPAGIAIPELAGVAVVADRDVDQSGSIGSGATIVGEQLDWSGGMNGVGMIIIQDRVDTPESLVSGNNVTVSGDISGNFVFEYNSDLTLPFPAGLRVQNWNEL